MEKGKMAKQLFENGYNCSQAIVLAFKDELNIEEKTLLSLSSSFGGGISRLREVCGCISGMAIVLGVLYGDYDPLDNNAKANHYQLIQKLSLKFKEKFSSYICADLLDKVKQVDSYIPEIRNKEYYANRPCGKYISYMADLIKQEIDERKN